jgi:uncharacterized protein YndB with AHSA1/START domain
MMIDAEDLVIRKEIHVGVPVERAFEVFTAGFADWWPSETHSMANGQVTADWRVGGLIVEETGNERFEWADVLEIDPPSSFRLRWRVNPEKPATEVTVSFAPEDGGTRIALVHSGWEVFADRAEEEFQGYTSGWDIVLSNYVSGSER